MVILHIIFDIIFSICLIWCGKKDYLTKTIPNRAVLIIFILAAAQIVILSIFGEPVFVFLLSLVMLLPILTWWKQGKMGGGDVKLFIASALYMGMLNFTIALINTLLMTAINRKKLTDRIPMAAYFMPAAIIVTAIMYLFMV